MPGWDENPGGGLGDAGTDEGLSFGLYLWELLPRPLRLLDRKRIIAEARFWLMAVGESVSELMTAVAKFRRNRHPFTAEPDALAFLAWERWLPQLQDESADEWRTRLRQAFPLHQEGGTNAAVLRILGILGLTTASIDEHVFTVTYANGRYDADGSRTAGAPGDNWALFDVVVDPSEWSAAPEFVAKMRGAINKTKAGHAKLRYFRSETDLYCDGAVNADGTALADGHTLFWA